MVRFILRALVAALGLFVAAKLFHLVTLGPPSELEALVVAGLLLGVVNALVRPIVTLLTLPLTIVTLGLFLLIVNGLMLFLVSWLLHVLGIRTFELHSMTHAVLTVIVIWLVSLVANMFLGDELRNQPRRR